MRECYARCLGLLRLAGRGFAVGAVAGGAVYLLLAQLILGHVWPHSR